MPANDLDHQDFIWAEERNKRRLQMAQRKLGLWLGICQPPAGSVVSGSLQAPLRPRRSLLVPDRDLVLSAYTNLR
ncbi:hypothetical protein VQ045_07400 [Aurantimonas sp. E1-2-R+4]|uniref:hypothetical protein n=1 Tax=Aurantimonas sp. E1-2-R+4 TaxID=3113714 RepID=UPI002F9394C4